MTNPIFYDDVVALDKTRHGDLKLHTPDRPLAYAANAQLLPAVVDEFELAMGDVALAFLPAQPHPAAVFVCGLTSDRNLFITKDGLWDAPYVPAYLRRYPFIIGDVEGGDALLCIDQSYEGFGKRKGEPLFDKSGEPLEPISRGLTLAQSYRDAAQRTDEFSRMLSELGLFRSVTLNATLESGEKTSVHGLMVVDEQALAGLGADALHELNQKGFLKAIYSHLFSLKAIGRLGARHSGQTDAEHDAPVELEPAE